MSGPIEYDVIISAARLIEMQRRQQAIQRARQAATRQRLDAARIDAQNRVRQTQVERGQATQAALQARRQQTEAVLLAARAHVASLPAQAEQERVAEAVTLLDSLQATWDQVIESSVGDEPALSSLAERVTEVSQAATRDAAWRADVSQLVQTLQTLHAGQSQRQSQLELVMQSLVAWQQELLSDEDVQNFQQAVATQWQQRTAELLERCSQTASIDELLPLAIELDELAEQLYAQAGELRTKFETRNELLSEIITSLKEVGFFVTDPQYEEPGNPNSPVLVKASRGSEEMVASVDLDEAVRSVWNGFEGDTCKEAFFAYVDQLQSKGIEIQSNHVDMHTRPKLKQEGAKRLPAGDTKQAGH